MLNTHTGVVSVGQGVCVAVAHTPHSEELIERITVNLSLFACPRYKTHREPIISYPYSFGVVIGLQCSILNA